MSEVFDLYGKYYDLLYRDKDYAAEAAFVGGRIRAHAPTAASVLELGCGTGAHAEHLARLGFSVHGIDRSETMLARALARRELADEDSRPRLSFAAGDVRSLAIERSFDVVIALFHVISYQTSNADLKAAFATAARHLRPGGLFVFDFWYGPAVLAQRPEVRVKRLANEELSLIRIAEPVLHDADNIVDVNYTTLVTPTHAQRTEQICETHRMRYLFLPELAELRGTAFAELSTTAWMSSAAADRASWSAVQTLVRR